MQKRILPAFFGLISLIVFIGYGCTKLDTSTLGSDLLAVDNVNTFADTLDVLATQGVFDDSTVVLKTDNQVIGKITTDPLFGQTDAAIYAQFKPTFYPFYFGNPGDTVYFGSTPSPLHSPNAGFDSAFVCLSFKGTWGDSSAAGAIPLTFEVKEISDQSFRINTDTLRKLNFPPPTTTGPVLGRAVITPAIARKKVILARGRDSVTDQIRIKLDLTSWAATFFNSKDTVPSSPNNALLRDSLFRKQLHGFEIKVTNPTGNTLYFVNLAEAKSRLEFHYHKRSNTGVFDTVVQSFQFYTQSVGTTAQSSGTDYVKRTHPSWITSPSATPNDVFLQTSPGTFAHVKIPGLTGYANRIVHRAYLVVEQTPDVAATDNIYTPPPYLYMDLKDTSTVMPQRYKPVYYDLSTNIPYDPDATGINYLYHPFPISNVDISNFGGRMLQRYDGSVPFARYEMNITRYVQHIVSNGLHNYDLRLYAPYSYYYPQYNGSQYVIPYYNPLAYGRVRVGAGSPANVGNHHMRLVVVYSKI